MISLQHTNPVPDPTLKGKRSARHEIGIAYDHKYTEAVKSGGSGHGRTTIWESLLNIVQAAVPYGAIAHYPDDYWNIHHLEIVGTCSLRSTSFEQLLACHANNWTPSLLQSLQHIESHTGRLWGCLATSLLQSVRLFRRFGADCFTDIHRPRLAG